MDGDKKEKNLLPGAILISALIVAGALVYSVGAKNVDRGAGLVKSQAEEKPKSGAFRPVDASDHILGDPNAPVKIIEYSDLECPFCKRFHPTMQQVLEAYNGQVAWVYRHFPLDSIHPKARREAEATECAAELGGNAKFWEYVEELFRITPSNNGLNLSLLPQIAESVGLDAAQFNTCLNSGKYEDKVDRDLQEAIAAGARGTPYSIIVTGKSKKVGEISGALQYSQIKPMIDQALKSQ